MEEQFEIGTQQGDDGTPEHWTQPPATDKRLYDYFTGAGMGFAGFDPTSAGSSSGPRGMPDPDGKLVRRGIVKLGHESGRESTADAFRRTAAIVESMDPAQVRVLRLAYGAQDAVPELKLSDNAQARARLEQVEDVSKAERERQRQRSRRLKDLGSWRQVMPETEAARAAFLAWVRERDAKRAKVVDESKAARHAEAEMLMVAREEARAKHAEARAVACRLGLLGDERKAERVAASKLATEQGAAVERFTRQIEALVGSNPDLVVVTPASVARWLAFEASTKTVSAARTEAHQLVKRAWNTWADLRGRRMRHAQATEPGSLKPAGWS